GEDRCLIQRYFSGVCEGKYLEVGAVDGIQSSNTYAFYKVMGWKGVNVEIDSENFQRLEHNRRDDIANVHAAVCSESQKIHYAHAAGEDKEAGAIWEFTSQSHRDQHWPNMTKFQTIPLKCTHLQSILDKTVGPGKYFFDLATFDLSGAELSALLGIDFDRISFGVIIIERNEDAPANQQIEDLLRSKGYSETYVKDWGCGTGKWFVHHDFRNIYQKRSKDRNIRRRR
ncbi:hypothetical protein ACHAXR_010758, partial [Thalassiosira sp. AJA248-18]